MCVWKDENKWKRGWGWPIFFKKTVKMSIKKLSMARFEPAGLLSNRSQMCHKHEYL